MVLASATVLTVIGLSAVTVSRVNTHATVQANRWTDAQSLAFSASEHALATINADDNWRNTLQGINVVRSMNRMTFSWQVVDEVDGDLRDNSGEGATLLVSATSGSGRSEANYALRVDLVVSSDGGSGGGSGGGGPGKTVRMWGVDEDNGELFSIDDYTAQDVGFTSCGRLRWTDRHGHAHYLGRGVKAFAVDDGGVSYMIHKDSLGSTEGPVLLRFDLNGRSLTQPNVAEVVGTVGWGKDVTGLSFEPKTGKLYAVAMPVSGKKGGGHLLVIDKAGGELLSDVGELKSADDGKGKGKGHKDDHKGDKITKPQGLTFDDDGNVYVVDEGGKMYRVNKDTAEVIECIDAKLPNGGKYGSVVWDSANGRLLASYTGHGDKTLWEITPTDGGDVAWVNLGSFGINDAEGLAFTPGLMNGSGKLRPALSSSAITRVVQSQ